MANTKKLYKGQEMPLPRHDGRLTSPTPKKAQKPLKMPFVGILLGACG
jgi:hypothetical protein